MRFPRLCGLVIAVIACDDTPFAFTDATLEDLQSVTLQTDRTSYTAALLGGEGAYRTYGATVVARLTNGGSHTVYLLRCYPDTPYPTYGVTATDEDVESGYDPVWACVGHRHHIAVGPGETRPDSLLIAGPHAWDGITKEPLGALTGRFRLNYSVGVCSDLEDCGGDRLALLSNEFEMQREDLP